MAGRPTSLTPDVHELIVKAVRAGNFLETAAAAAGVHRTTVHLWIQRGEKDEADEPYATFALEVVQARAFCEMERVANIIDAKPGVPGVSGADIWQKDAWWLERHRPAQYSGKVKATVEEMVDGLMRTLASVLDADSLEKVRHALASRQDSGPGSPAAGAKH